MGMLNEVKSKNKLKAAHNWLKMAENAKTPEKQIDYYTKALDANPYNAEAWLRKGRVFEKIGNFEEAKRCFDLATEIDPGYQELVGKKQYGEQTSTEYNGGSVFQESRMQEYVYQESNIGEEFSEKTIEQLGEETGEELSEGYEEQPVARPVTEKSSFTGSTYKPPAGDESIFSSLRGEDVVSDRDIEDVDPDDPIVIEGHAGNGQENETFSFTDAYSGKADVSCKTGREAAVNSIAVSQSSQDSFWKESSPQISDLKEPEFSGKVKTASVKKDLGEKKPVPVNPAGIKLPEESKLQDQYKEVRPAVSGKVMEDSQNMDIRIPINETVKFWAVGIVAMLIAFKLMAYI